MIVRSGDFIASVTCCSAGGAAAIIGINAKRKMGPGIKIFFINFDVQSSMLDVRRLGTSNANIEHRTPNVQRRTTMVDRAANYAYFASPFLRGCSDGL